MPEKSFLVEKSKPSPIISNKFPARFPPENNKESTVIALVTCFGAFIIVIFGASFLLNKSSHFVATTIPSTRTVGALAAVPCRSAIVPISLSVSLSAVGVVEIGVVGSLSVITGFTYKTTSSSVVLPLLMVYFSTKR